MYKSKSPYTLQHVRMKNYDGFFLGFHLKPLDVERTKEHLPLWLPYLGYALLTAALVAGAIAIGCICVKCCRPFCVSKGNDDDDDENRGENTRRFARNSVLPVNNSQPVN